MKTKAEKKPKPDVRRLALDLADEVDALWNANGDLKGWSTERILEACHREVLHIWNTRAAMIRALNDSHFDFATVYRGRDDLVLVEMPAKAWRQLRALHKKHVQ